MALARAVKVTSGRVGRNVSDREEVRVLAPDSSNDGVHLAKEIELEDPFEKHRRKADCSRWPPKPRTRPAMHHDGAPPPKKKPCCPGLVQSRAANVAAGANSVGWRRGMKAATRRSVDRIARLSEPWRMRRSPVATVS